MEEVTWKGFDIGIEALVRIIPKDYYSHLYPIKRGGVPVAVALAAKLGIKISDRILGQNTLVIDDIADSGATLSIFKEMGIATATLYKKPKSLVTPTYYIYETAEWVKFPWESEEAPAEDNITRILQSIGEDPLREGLKDTPARVSKMHREIYKGYDPAQKPKITVFPNGEDGVCINQMVVDSGTYVSWCEHHMLPFFGHYHFAYIPNKSIVGLSKIARIVDYHASRLQVQERLTAQIVNDLHDALCPVGMALQMRGRHLCKEIRGAKNNGEMVTTELRGVFEEQQVRMEFLHIIGR